MKLEEFLQSLLSDGSMRMSNKIIVEANGQIDFEIKGIYVDRNGQICIKIEVEQEQIDF